MAGRPRLGHGQAMNPAQHPHDIAEGAYELWLAAGGFEQSAAGGDTSVALPEALDYLKDALELLATGVAKASQAIDDQAHHTEGEELSPQARALRWYLAHLSARLLGARDVCPEARRWALDQRGADAEPAPA
jgi:hypothetical protein